MLNHSELLKAHMDRHCGKIPTLYFKEDSTGIGVAKFVDLPDVGLTTFVSTGLSGHILKQNSGVDIRQELLMTVDNKFGKMQHEISLFTMAKIILDSHKGILREQIIGPLGLIYPEEKKSHLTGFVCSHPAFFDEEFHSFTNDLDTVFVELIPITTPESLAIKERRWSEFFEAVDKGGIDILDLFRKSVRV